MGLFIASEALAAGRVSRYELVADYRRVLPDVYAPKRIALSNEDRIAAAWLWSRREGVICGLAASALHGALWVDPASPVELNLPHNKSPSGVITRRDTIFCAGLLTHGEKGRGSAATDGALHPTHLGLGR